MWKVKLVCLMLMVAMMNAEGATKKRVRRFRKRQVGGYTGGYGGGYGNGAYAGGFASAGGYGTGGFAGTGFDYAPDFGAGFIDPYLFHQQLTAQILAQHAAQTNAIVTTFSEGNGHAEGVASVQPDDDQIQQQIANQAYNNNKPHRYASNFAGASGSIGPGGYYQTAYINPENPSRPNIVNRFGAASPGGYKGVSVSSYSTSSDVNGKRTGHRGAQTTINDNGKITSYNVQS